MPWPISRSHLEILGLHRRVLIHVVRGVDHKEQVVRRTPVEKQLCGVRRSHKPDGDIWKVRFEGTKEHVHATYAKSISFPFLNI